MPLELKLSGLSCLGITLPSSLPKSVTKKGTRTSLQSHFQALKKNRAPKCLGGRITPSTNQSHAHTPVAYLDTLEQLRCSIKSWKPIRKFSTGFQWAEHHPRNTRFPFRLKRWTMPITTISFLFCLLKDMDKVDKSFFTPDSPSITQRLPKFKLAVPNNTVLISHKLNQIYKSLL